ncbi:hypothetical protein [Nocardia sp. BMG111209]|uniref:hypothetical protein n=1 Tax=Nocardia sp. BMG111209 TaxID=1160137 RepID=UPI00035F7F95|nr:hypothetical protein [Nocardia sp. BMG111209]
MPVDRETDERPAGARVDLRKRAKPDPVRPPDTATGAPGPPETATRTEATTTVGEPLRFRPPIRRSTTPPLGIVAATVGVVALVLVAVVLGSHGGGSHGGDSYSGGSPAAGSEQRTGVAAAAAATACSATSPGGTVTGIVARGDALDITVAITAGCAGGDALSAPRAQLTVSVGSLPIAAGLVDLPATSGARAQMVHVFRFPAGTYWRTPDLIGSPTALRVTFARTSAAVDRTAAAGGTEPIPVTPAAETDAESIARAALPAIADADRPAVAGQLADRWVPQLSSKEHGRFAEGITWNDAEILREHLQLRLRYPNVRLVWSGSWSTFSGQYFWITSAGVTFADAGGALDWCRSNQLDPDHCYAKVISTTHPVDGSTAFQPG